MTDLYDLHMKKWCLSIATLNKRRVTIFPQTNVQPVMVSPLMASMPMKAERAELLELMGCAWPVTKKTCSSLAKKARKPSSTSAGNIKSKLLNWNLWDNIWLPRTGPSSFRPHWLLKTLGCREFDSALLEKPFDMSFDGEWKVMYVDIDKNDLTIDWNVWKFSSWEVFIPPFVYQCRNFETWSYDQKPAMQLNWNPIKHLTPESVKFQLARVFASNKESASSQKT